jgi:PAS domain-containing protein
MSHIGEDLLRDIGQDLSLPSREELLDEISRKNDELAESKQLMQSVLENIHSIVYAKDADGRYTYLNHEWETVMGLDRENRWA